MQITVEPAWMISCPGCEQLSESKGGAVNFCQADFEALKAARQHADRRRCKLCATEILGVTALTTAPVRLETW